MFNPQLDKLDWRTIERRNTKAIGWEWELVDMIDLKKGDTFRAFEEDGTRVLHRDGRKEFVAVSNGYVGCLGIPEIEIE